MIDNKYKKVMTRELSKGDHAGIIVENNSDKCYDVTFGFKLQGYELIVEDDDEEEEETKDGKVEHVVTVDAGEKALIRLNATKKASGGGPSAGFGGMAGARGGMMALMADLEAVSNSY